jgi:rare lipoprotein A
MRTEGVVARTMAWKSEIGPWKELAGRRVCARALVLSCALLAFATPAGAKTPGETYCHNETCRRVRTLAETAALIGKPMKLKASYYDHCRRDRFNPCGVTSSGEPFRAEDANNAASAELPDGTLLLLFNPDTLAAAVVRINNAGPYHSDRQIDVSRATAEALGFRNKGIAQLEALILEVPAASEAQFRKDRRYPVAAGLIGNYVSLAMARTNLAVANASRSVSSAERDPSVSQPGPARTETHGARDSSAEVSAPDLALIESRIRETMPALSLPKEPPRLTIVARDTSADDAALVLRIVASLPPLSTRVLLGYPPLELLPAAVSPSRLPQASLRPSLADAAHAVSEADKERERQPAALEGAALPERFAFNLPHRKDPERTEARPSIGLPPESESSVTERTRHLIAWAVDRARPH